MLKEALTHPEREISQHIRSACLLITFLATPHHGSTILSDSRRLSQFRKVLGLENVIGDNFLSQMEPSSDYLETLNQFFVHHCLGVYLWTYGEQEMTSLPGDASRPRRENSVFDKLFGTESVQLIVDKMSSKITNPDHNITADEEEWDPLNTDHMGTARLSNSREVDNFLWWLKDELQPAKIQDWTNHRSLTTEILKNVNIERHSFDPLGYDGKIMVKLKTEVASLQAFTKFGPSAFQRAKSNPAGPTNALSKDKDVKTSAAQMLRPTSKGPFLKPAALAKTALMPERLPLARSRSDIDTLGSASSRPPSGLSGPGLSRSPERLSIDESHELVDKGPSRESRAENAALPELNARGSGQFPSFQWLHVPHSVPSWVPLVMNVLSDSKSTNLHKDVLTDDMWRQHHNNPTHDSPHGKFVRPHSQPLFTWRAGTEGSLPLVSSSTGQSQFAVYFPYL